LGSRRPPLSECDPLQVLLKEHLTRQFAARLLECVRLAALKVRGPFGPRPFLFTLMDSSGRGVVVNPPALLPDGPVQLARTGCVMAPFGLEKTVERGRQCGALQFPYFCVPDAGRLAHMSERFAIVRTERPGAAEQFEFRDRGN